MAKQTDIVKSLALKGELSKEQKRFNSYTNKIKNLKQGIEDLQKNMIDLRNIVQERIIPVELEMLDTRKNLIFALDASPFMSNLTDKQLQKYETMMFEQADDFLAQADYDEDIKLIFDKYSETPYDEVMAEGEAEAKNMASEMFKNMFGMDIDDEDFETMKDPSKGRKLFEKIADMQEKMKAEQEESARLEAERQAKRKKSAKQLQHEERQKAAEMVIQKTTKQIYMDLVKNFHPDAEQDEEKRAWKTEIMQKVTVAYGDNDYLKLLELQMTLMEDRENAVGTLDDTQLKYFNNVLQNQIRDLEQQMMMESPMYNPNIPYRELFSPFPVMMNRNVDRHINQCEKAKNTYRQQMESIQAPAGLKDFIKKYKVRRYDDFDMGDFIDMMNTMRFK